MHATQEEKQTVAGDLTRETPLYALFAKARS